MKKLLLLLCAFMASISGAWAQDPVNLALGASVTLGDAENYEQTINSGELAYVTDGKANTSLQMHYISKTSTALILDLGESKTFDAVILHQTGDRNVTSFSLSYSNDGETWSDPEVINNVIPGKFAANLTEEVNKRYVKYVSTRGNKNVTDEWGEGIAEIQLYNLTSPLAFEGITLTAPTTTTAVGGSNITITAQGNANQLGAIWPLGEITWTSTVPSVATIANGVLTPVSAGTTSITATSGGKTSNAIEITVNATMPNIPASVGTNKKGIYSAELGNTAGYGFQDWGGGNGLATTVNGTAAYQINNFKWFGSGFNKIDATTYEKLHLDIYPSFTGTLTIVPINRNIADDGNEIEKGTQFNVTADTWNSLELNIADLIENDGLSMERLYQIKYVSTVVKNAKGVTDGFGNGDGTGNFIVGNVYLYGTASTDTESPVMTKAVVASVGANTATLTVSATDNHNALTYTVKQGETIVGSGSGTQGADATVKISGLIAETNYPAGTFTVIATDAAGNGSDPMNVPEFTTTATPVGLELTAGGHTILIQGKHYLDRTEDNWELIITSEDDIEGWSGSYWTTSFGNESLKGEDIGNHTKPTLSGDKKTLTTTTTSTTRPSFYTPVYLFMPGEINFGEHGTSGNNDIPWVEVGAPTVEVSGNIAVVTGTLTTASVATIQTEAGYAASIDLTGATISETISITPNNVNAIIVVASGQSSFVNASNGNLVIKDGSTYTADAITYTDQPGTVPANLAITTGEVSYTRTGMEVGKLFSVVLPFSADIPANFKAYVVKAYDSYSSKMTFAEISGTLSAGTAYVIKSETTSDFVASKTTSTTLDFTEEKSTTAGVTTTANLKQILNVDVDKDKYVLSDNKIKKLVGTAKVAAFRGYFTLPIPSAGSNVIDFNLEGDVTGIENLKSDNLDNAVFYDLNGHRVANPTKGLYIVNGKKVILK